MEEDRLFVDPNDKLACHVSYRGGPSPWVVFLFDIDSGYPVWAKRFWNIDAAHAYVRTCLPNLTIPDGESI